MTYKNINIDEIKLVEKNIFDIDLEKIWTATLKESNTTPFQDYNWQKNWFEEIGKSKKFSLSILCFFFNDECISIFPFCMKNSIFLKTLYWNGGLQTDYNIQIIKEIYNEKKIISHIWSLILKKYKNCDLINLDKIPEYINNRKNKLLEVINITKSSNSYQVLLNKEKLDELYNKKIIKDNLRQIRRLNKIGKIEFIIGNNENINNIIIKKMIEQKSLRYQSTNAWDMFSEKHNIKFYLNFSKKELFKNLDIHCSYLLLNDEIIATHFGLKSNQCFFYLMPGNEFKKYGKYSPGKILLQYLIKWSYENNINSFDLTVGDEKYKKYWSNNSYSIFQSKISTSLKGLILLKLLKYKYFFKRIPFARVIYNKFIN